MPTSAVVVGDFGVGGIRQQALGSAVRLFAGSHRVDALTTTGDNDYASTPASFDANWSASFGWLRGAGIPVIGALGNHDVEGRLPDYQYSALDMTERWYARTVGNVRFIVLDSNAPDDPQRQFLRRELSGSPALWRVVVFHHPPVTCGAYRGRTGDTGGRFLSELRRGNARLVLSGHDHNYQRFVGLDGETYVVDGFGAADLYPLRKCLAAPFAQAASDDAHHGFLHLEAGLDQIKGTAYTVEGRVVDSFVVER